MASRLSFFSAFVLLFAVPAFAWDYEGHRAVNQLAIASLPNDFPPFVKTPEARERIAFLAGEPDRWRNLSATDFPLKHVNAPDHFIDFEDVEAAGLAPNDLTEFRQVFAAQLALGEAKHPDRFPTIDPEKNKDHTRELVGFLPWAIIENFGKLKSAFSYLKAFEEAGTSEEVANARANVIYIMGVMGHYVGDGSQPLHTTKHYNGWNGDNPKKYTTSKGFHAWIDGGFIVKTGGLALPSLEQRLKPAHMVGGGRDAQGRDPVFVDVLSYLLGSFGDVEHLYALDKEGKLHPENASSAEGKAFIEGQILAAGTMLGSLWLTAWRDAPADTFLRGQLLARKTKASSE
jgi:hypothetical protein